MQAFSSFVREKLIKGILDDIRDFRIFNEPDLQYRTAFHIDKEYFKTEKHYLMNQPRIPVGKGRDKSNVRPDIVVFKLSKNKAEPIVAFELKCFIKGTYSSSASILNPALDDIEKLGKFRQRYTESNNAFAIIVGRVEDRDLHMKIQNEFTRNKEKWMPHYLKVHFINICFSEEGRKRSWYNKEWLGEWRDWENDFSNL